MKSDNSAVKRESWLVVEGLAWSSGIVKNTGIILQQDMFSPNVTYVVRSGNHWSLEENYVVDWAAIFLKYPSLVNLKSKAAMKTDFLSTYLRGSATIKKTWLRISKRFNVIFSTLYCTAKSTSSSLVDLILSWTLLTYGSHTDKKLEQNGKTRVFPAAEMFYWCEWQVALCRILCSVS